MLVPTPSSVSASVATRVRLEVDVLSGRVPMRSSSTIAVGCRLIGVTEPEIAEYSPIPTPFTAATRNTYAVPLVRPVTVVEVAVEAARLNVVHVLPSLLLY